MSLGIDRHTKSTTSRMDLLLLLALIVAQSWLTTTTTTTATTTTTMKTCHNFHVVKVNRKHHKQTAFIQSAVPQGSQLPEKLRSGTSNERKQ